MRRPSSLAALALALLTPLGGCIGEFALTRDVWRKNQQIESKVAREAAFFGLLVIPVYEATLLADLLVFNTIELFSGENPWGEHRDEDARP